ncbi:hypothetical protein DTL42_01350 [Bremerella cremea]|uniref:Uncharacterized protein n=1 Tax=Bremerella cremea TaxID=1031537 RepID=A0A368KXB7_9BACT|nr:hypothetical protein [Bremerella cremea]RCS55777.1 hypothetical protein DTL42_01350 [Bremerella cremea]
MALTFFDHRNKRIFETSPEKDAQIDLGTYHVDSDTRRIEDSRYDLLFSVNSQVAFPKCKGLPATLPILYQTRKPDFDSFAYRVHDDFLVEIINTSETLDLRDAMKSPGQPLLGAEIPYNPRKAEDALAWAGVFSLKKLSRREMKRAIAIVDERWGGDWSPYCVVPWEKGTKKSTMIQLEWVQPFGQNASFSCPDWRRRCKEGFFGTPTLPLILYEESPEMNLFGDFNPQLIITYCRRCRTIGVVNQCD